MANTQHAEAAAHYFRDIAHILRSRPSAWAQGVYARDADNRGAPPTSSRAVAWCAMGFLELVAPGKTELRSYMANMLGHMVRGSVPAWNDDPSRTVDDVINLFESAASRCANVRIAVPNWHVLAKPGSVLAPMVSMIERIEAEAA